MITISRSKYGFTVEGHAEYAESGRDIVCSAVSALAQTAALALKEYTSTSVYSRKGFMEVYVSDLSADAHVIMDTIFIGFREIAKQYPNHVKVEEM